MKEQKIADGIVYIGVNDRTIDLFESQYVVPNGVSYNSYCILDEKIAIMDTVDYRMSGEWLMNLDAVLQGKVPDYLIISHLEPDHGTNGALAGSYGRIRAERKDSVFCGWLWKIWCIGYRRTVG